MQLGGGGRKSEQFVLAGQRVQVAGEGAEEEVPARGLWLHQLVGQGVVGRRQLVPPTCRDDGVAADLWKLGDRRGGSMVRRVATERGSAGDGGQAEGVHVLAEGGL